MVQYMTNNNDTFMVQYMTNNDDTFYGPVYDQ